MFNSVWACPGYDTKLRLMVRLQFWRYGEGGVLFIAITSISNLTQSGSICQGLFYELMFNRQYIFNRTVCTKKKNILRNNYIKKCIYECTMDAIPKPLDIK